MNIPWVKVEPPQLLDGFLIPGYLLALTTGEHLWVGNVNDVGGVCDDCAHEAMSKRSTTRVTAYWNANEREARHGSNV